MGRPLFVAPVETDLPHKDAPKRDVLSPSRSAIRRSTQTETRERRNPNRRTGVRIVALQPHSRSTRSYPPWGLDDGTRHLTPSLYDHEEPSSGPAREALRDVTSRPPRSDRRLEDRMSSLFGGTWHNIGPPSSQRNDEAASDRDFWWNIETRPQPRRARILAPENPPRRNRSPHGRRSYHIGTPPYRPTRDGSERLQSESATSNDDTAPQYAFAPYRSLRRNQARAFRTFMGADASSRIRQRTHATDGLGDRDRSLSPEVWDTLLTTLTPDPQPPSASSSFASAAVSQSAGPSNAPPPAPGLPDETADGACESGHEMSEDEEGVLYRFPHEVGTIDEQLRRHFRRRPSVPDYNLDGPSDGPLDRPLDGPQSHRSEASRPGQSPGDSRTNGYALLLTNSWLTRAGSEDERGADRTRPNREGSAGSGHGVQTGDEEWLGMRRIVQSLAAREDIPDEWWAEAGLSRTLPHDESN
ncbi:uncharacterized protein TRIVIDRAFT_79398 [Trichoderma virens Gv29-8]|uniref:Uncharacterized protein n=1 Tax=Hypocrea virens (strain Gv29-8 / FGSC 10586) TaxID=413071 RepID=G9MJR3_HYPVG|nr:uncharacterized protein TRIVIDRAFT_79398 [Trichoderma virens Gv29-8]EHK25725.1 hypothetical protein TRIVIDRAFT_79398 [Trichoderma virens Gv29-8]